jgi:hypothetical protein
MISKSNSMDFRVNVFSHIRVARAHTMYVPWHPSSTAPSITFHTRLLRLPSEKGLRMSGLKDPRQSWAGLFKTALALLALNQLDFKDLAPRTGSWRFTPRITYAVLNASNVSIIVVKQHNGWVVSLGVAVAEENRIGPTRGFLDNL